MSRDYDDEDRPRKKKRRRRDDDDDDDEEEERRPRKRRRDDDEDEDEEEEEERRPRKRRARDDEYDDDDEEERPRRKRKKLKRPKRALALPAWFDPYIGGAGFLGVVGLFFIGGALIFPALALVPMGLGLILTMAGGLWLLMVAFQDDVTAGIFCLLIPLYGLYYAVTHFDDCKRAICLWLVGFVLVLSGSCLGGFQEQRRGGPRMRVEVEIQRVCRVPANA
jgi:hypothetical protein